LYYLQLFKIKIIYGVRIITIKHYRINNILSWTQPRIIEIADKKSVDKGLLYSNTDICFQKYLKYVYEYLIKEIIQVRMQIL
jgi:hypothetical protein